MASTFPTRYIPSSLSTNDRKKQTRALLRSKKQYTNKVYIDRPKLASFKPKQSKHLAHAYTTYGVRDMTPNEDLAEKTGCSVDALRQIVRKGEGAYYSSGSRPNQTAQSWGLARLASALTAGKAAAVDYTILEKGCDPTKKAIQLANEARRKYNHGQAKTKKVKV